MPHLIEDQWDFVNNRQRVTGQRDVVHSEAHGTATCSVLGASVAPTLVGVAFNARFLLAKTEDVFEVCG
jgi:hypothetical protein